MTLYAVAIYAEDGGALLCAAEERQRKTTDTDCVAPVDLGRLGHVLACVSRLTDG